MIHAYDEMYVEGAMIHMGDMIEYACPDCRYAPDGFWRMFLQNEVVRRFEIGDESVVAGSRDRSWPYVDLAAIEKSEMIDTRAAGCLHILSGTQRSRFLLSGAVSTFGRLQKMYSVFHEAVIAKVADMLLEI